LEHLWDVIYDIKDNFSETDEGCYARDRGVNPGFRRSTKESKALEIMDDEDLD
jgi:hypothetical protein